MSWLMLDVRLHSWSDLLNNAPMLAYLIQESSTKTRRLWLVLPVIFPLLLAVSASCVYESHAPPAPQAGQAQPTQTGLASFYSRAFDGEETASGETFDSREMVAAHPSHPLGTVVRVTNLEKGERSKCGFTTEVHLRKTGLKGSSLICRARQQRRSGWSRTVDVGCRWRCWSGAAMSEGRWNGNCAR